MMAKQSQTSKSLFGSLILLCCSLLAFLGCSSGNVGEVRGKVTLAGEPVSKGTIVFEGQGLSVNAPLKADGTFEIRTHDQAGLPPGKYQVAISSHAVGSGTAPLVSDPTQSAEPTSQIPAKYQQVATSGLSAQVEAGKNKPFEFDLVAE